MKIILDAWEIRTLNPSPSLTESIVEFTGTYVEAVKEANRMHVTTGRTSSVVRDMCYWYQVRNHVGLSKNKGSGVPDQQYVGCDWLEKVTV